MLDHVLRAFDLLIKSGELGAADSRSLNALSPELDQQGEIGRDELIELLFTESKDPDGACRSFLSRLKAAAQQAADEAERQGDGKAAAMFRSITVARIKAKGGAARLRFSAQAPKELPQVTARANRDYLPENYQPSTGCKPEDLPQLQRQELCRKPEVVEEKRHRCLLEAGRKDLYECHEFVEVRGERAEIRTAGERNLLRDRTEDEGKGKCEALADLFDWLEHSEASLYALLGDYGMGKTFTCRIFAQRLAERCENEPNLLKPVYLDLRDVPTFVTVHGKTRQPTLEEMLETVLRLNGQDGEYTAKELIRAARQGKLLCIFDGLDEKLVYYTADMRSQFLNELLRVFPQCKVVYLDLFDMPVFITLDGKAIHRQPLLEEMLDIALRLNMHKKYTYTAKELIDEAKKEKLSCIFSGLNKMLVSYPANMRSQFLNELQRAFPQDKVKIVISCRTHHFETITQMDGFLLGLNRSGLRSCDYRALHLLPFSSEQIQALLTKILGAEEAAQIFAFIEDEAYLKDLAQRPFLLRQLSRLLPKLRELKNQGKPINAAGFYQALIEDCLNRDEEKNIVKPRHKLLLLTDLAAEFWQSSTQLWQIDRLNDWFCAWLQKQPELAAQYSSVDGQLLEKDLRNSTLLVRFGKQDFGFSHSSMQEFFLSKWLLRQWQEDDQFCMDQPVSSLTRQFVFDNLALLTEQELERINKGLAATLARPWSDTSELALDIIAELARQKKAVPELGDVDLRRSFLSNRQIRGLHGQRLLLDQAEAHASQWLDCHFQQIDIGQGNISGSLWRDCSWQHIVEAKNFSPLRNDVTLASCRIAEAVHEPPLQKNCHLFPPTARQTAHEPFRLEDWQQGHSGMVLSCCFSPDGSRILSAAANSTLKLSDLAGKCLRTLLGHKHGVRSCAFSPDGSRILSAAYDKTLKLWDLDGNCLKTLQGHKRGVLSCAFSPDGKHVLSGAEDKMLKLWDLEGNCLRTLQGHKDTVRSCAFSPDGQRVLSAAYDKTLKLWDLTGNCLRTLQGHSGRVQSCAFSPDGSRILSAANDQTLKLWDLEGNCLRTLQGHEDYVLSCAFSPDGQRVLSSSFDKTLKLWDLAGNCLRTLRGHEDYVQSCAFSPDGKHVLSASYDSIKLWGLEGNCLRTLQKHSIEVQSCAFSPDGQRILSAAEDSTLNLWDLEGNCLITLRGHEDWGRVNSCAFGPDGQRVLSAADDSTLKLWDLAGNCLRTLQGHKDTVRSCAFSPDGQHVLSAADDSTLKLWDLAGNCLRTLQGHKDTVRSCAFSPDGQHVLSAADDSTLKLWDLAGNCLRTLQGHEDGVQSCAFSPDGQHVLSASYDSIKLWDLAGNCLRTLQGHEGWVNSCAFSPDGSRILSASADGTLRFWRLDGTLERIFTAGRGQWYAAFFSSNQLEKIIGTELSWKMANFAKDGETWTLDETGCFEWVPAEY